MNLNDFDPVAKNYDNFYPTLGLNNNGFEEYHLSLAAKHGEGGVLDIACGTGVLTIPLLQAGYDVSALDLSAQMIEVTREKLYKENLQAELLVANMTDFAIDRKFSLAIIARSGFLYLLTTKEQQQTLSNIREHLTDGGVLTLNTYQPHPIIQAKHMKGESDEYDLRTEYINHEGKKVRMSKTAKYDHLAQVMRGNWKFETLDDFDNIIDTTVCPQATRHTYRHEMEYLFKLCGYEISAVYDNYLRDAARDHHIWIVKKR